MKRCKHFIAGEWVDSSSGETREIINPSNGEVIALAAEGTRKDAEVAISAARRAFDTGPWPKTTNHDRAELIREISRLIAENRDELAGLETLDTGKTLPESLWDIEDVIAVFDYYAGLVDHVGSERLETPRTDSESRLVREPIGVCGQICPWNYPLLQASWKVAPALAAGCTVVIKPSEITPLTTVKLTKLIAEAGLPPGVFNLVLGPGDPVGAELAESQLVDLVSFTGGIETGKRIISAAARNVKKIALELGGKNPLIVFSDADLDLAVDHALNGNFFHAGQICSAGARILVQEPIHDAFVAALAERMERIVLGDGFSQGTQMGPLISEDHRTKVEGHIRVATEEGAHLRLGGCRPEDSALEHGFFLSPTLLIGCTDEMRIVREEVFGPVVSVETFDTETEATGRANDNETGLSAGVFTTDLERIERVSKALRFGTVWVNDYNVYFPEAPWGGYRQSGLGRELGTLGLDEYLEVKHVFVNHKPEKLGWFGE